MNKILALGFVLSFLFIPGVSNAQTTSELQAQINLLLVQIAQLQAQLNATQTTAPSSSSASTVSATAGGNPGECYAPRVRYALRLGMTDGTTDGQVSNLQRFLQQIVPTVQITGSFNSETEEAVKKFQRDRRIVSTGSWNTTGYGATGPRTRASIANYCASTTTSTSGTGNTGVGTVTIPPILPSLPSTPSQIACPADVQMCSNGTYVSRDPANGCAFKACSGTQTTGALPTVTTGAVMSYDFTQQKITFSGSYSSKGIMNTGWFEFWENDFIQKTAEQALTTGQNLSFSADGFPKVGIGLVKYYYRAVVKNEFGTSYGPVLNFTPTQGVTSPSIQWFTASSGATPGYMYLSWSTQNAPTVYLKMDCKEWFSLAAKGMELGIHCGQTIPLQFSAGEIAFAPQKDIYPPGATASFTLTAQAAKENFVEKTVSYTFLPTQPAIVETPIPTPISQAPAVDILVASVKGGSDGPLNVPYGDKPVLSWTSTNTTSCTSSGRWGTGTKLTTGSETQYPVFTESTYTITCTSPSGQTATDSVKIIPSDPTLTVDLKADGSDTPIVQYNSGFVLSWAVSPAVNYCKMSWDPSFTAYGSGGYEVKPIISNTSYMITCYGYLGSISDIVNVRIDTTSRECTGTNANCQLLKVEPDTQMAASITAIDRILKEIQGQIERIKRERSMR